MSDPDTRGTCDAVIFDVDAVTDVALAPAEASNAVLAEVSPSTSSVGVEGRDAASDLGSALRPPTGWCGGASVDGGPWTLRYEGFDPEQEGTREALCTLGNGYWAARGAAAESFADGVHYPGTYLAGVYNRLRTEIADRTVEDEHMVNAPNWLALSFGIEGEDWLTTNSAEVLEQRQELDLRRAVLSRTVVLRDPAGRTLRVTSDRFVSQADRHLAAMRTTLEALNWTGQLTVRSGIDGSVTNDNVDEYRPLTHSHL